MAFIVDLEDGEELIFEDTFIVKKGADPFGFAVSNRAAYLPRKKPFALRDPWYLERVPVHRIREVSVERMRPYLLWVVALVLVVVGGVTSYWVLQPEYRNGGGVVSGYPFGLLAAGLALPFAARGRRRLVVSMVESRFVWKAPLLLDRKSRRRVKEIREGIISAFETIHVPVRVA